MITLAAGLLQSLFGHKSAPAAAAAPQQPAAAGQKVSFESLLAELKKS